MNNKCCYLCEGSDFKTRPGNVRDNKHLKILECNECGLVFLDGHDHITEDHYQNSGMHDFKPDYDRWLIDCKKDDSRRIDFLKPKIANKTLLDFGCGIGGFLGLASQFCKKCYGLELEVGMQESFSQRGLKVYSNYDDLLSSGLKFDIITSFHVVEHLKNPSEILKNLSQILNNNGEIIVEVPSSSDALLSLFNSVPFQNFTYWSQHLYLFNPDTFLKLSKKAELSLNWVKSIQRYPLSNHLHWLSQGLPGGHEKWSFLDSPKLTNAYEETLASLGITDTLIASLSKPDLD